MIQRLKHRYPPSSSLHKAAGSPHKYARAGESHSEKTLETAPSLAPPSQMASTASSKLESGQMGRSPEPRVRPRKHTKRRARDRRPGWQANSISDGKRHSHDPSHPRAKTSKTLYAEPASTSTSRVPADIPDAGTA